MLRAALIVSMLVTGACEKKGADSGASVDKKPAATTAAATVGSDGIRRVSIEAKAEGYVPDKIPGKPGEKLVLVFTRTVEGECMAELKAPDGKTYPLPMNKAVEVAVTVPQSGRVEFACGMDMVKGVVVADPRT